MVLVSVLATALVSVRLHAELMTLRYRIEARERERRELDRTLRLAAAELERVKAPYWQLRARDAARAALAGPGAPPPASPDAAREGGR
jgi:hypothetical protein